MSDKTIQAKNLFLGSFNCCQSTLAVFAEDLGISLQQANSLAAGFGAGMAYQGKTCGAVTGAYMALGLMSGQLYGEQEKVKEKTYELIKQFNENFESKHGSTECKLLLGVDLSTPAGMDEGKKKELFTTHCPNYVASAVGLVEKQMKEK